MLHIALHFIVPAILAGCVYRRSWYRAFTVMSATMVVDIDHLLADPIYDPARCSIGFHPLHSALPIAVYVALCWPKKTRLVGLGLLIHMGLDALDCV